MGVESSEVNALEIIFGSKTQINQAALADVSLPLAIRLLTRHKHVHGKSVALDTESSGAGSGVFCLYCICIGAAASKLNTQS
jgi:hypothetical protein